MSSLLQFHGDIKRDRCGRGVVGLEFYKVETRVKYSYYTTWYDGSTHVHDVTEQVDLEPVHCNKCGGNHPRLYIAYRRPVGMLGCWVVFRYNGEEHVPDLSVPISLDLDKGEHIPRDAKPLTDEQNAEYWHRP